MLVNTIKTFLKNLLKQTLKFLAILTIKKHKPTIVGITGSAGKTSIKEAIFCVLKKEYSVRRNRGNFNNELGLPLAILGDYNKIDSRVFWLKVICKAVCNLIFNKKLNYPEVLILEMAADKPGDIQYLTSIAKPDIGVITAIGDIPVHVEFYSGPEAVAKEKGYLIEALKSDGYAILNNDDLAVSGLKTRTRAQILNYGFSASADISLSNLEYRINEKGIAEGISFKVQYGGSFVPIRLNGVFGRPQAYSAGAAIAVGIAFNINLVEISEALFNYEAPDGRMKMLKGIKNTNLLDDSYNASPISMSAALETFEKLSGQRKIAILGDMLEIGEYSREEHLKVGKQVAQIADLLFCVGARAKFIEEGAKKAGMSQENIKTFSTSDSAKKQIQKTIKQGDLILLKASRGIHLENIIEEIKAEE